MEILQQALLFLYGFFGVWLIILLVYQMYLTVFGFKKETKDYEDHDPESRFLVLVPAHNEEAVIGDIIENLQEMDYPKEKYDFYIIADNCTDGTAAKARALGANVIETFKDGPDAATGKPIALKKALDAVGDWDQKYDLMMIFDADNLVDRNMFREVNSQYLDKGKPDFIQCYLGAKNKKGVIAWFYYTSYTVTNRFFQLAKHRRGLNCSIGGTGFAMSTAYLKERGGWTTMSLTEDFEIQIEATLQGRRILWNHNTRIYDEKPTRFVASFRQKIRWGQGHWFVCLRNTVPAFKLLFAGKLRLREFISMITYMYSLSAYVIAAIQFVLLMVLNFVPGFTEKIVYADFSGFITSGLLFVYSYLLLFYLADWIDNRIGFRLSTLPMMLFSFIISIPIGVANQIIGLIRHRQQHTWVKTEHKLHSNS